MYIVASRTAHDISEYWLWWHSQVIDVRFFERRIYIRRYPMILRYHTICLYTSSLVSLSFEIATEASLYFTFLFIYIY
ncbi:hypothetical protein BDZ91DRAFT_716545, partial [Kalaharituber pfeilii]